jgi:hypothetical protein
MTFPTFGKTPSPCLVGQTQRVAFAGHSGVETDGPGRRSRLDAKLEDAIVCGDWIRLDDEIARIMNGLVAPGRGREGGVKPGATIAPTTGNRLSGSAHHDSPGAAVVVQFKRPGAVAPGKVKGGEQTAEVGETSTRQPVALRYRR